MSIRVSANTALCALWSMTIFDRFEMNDSMSKEKDLLTGMINHRNENDIFLCFCWCFFCPLAMSGTISISIFLIFAWVQYGLSFNDWGDSEGVSGNGTKKARGIFSLLIIPDCFFRFLGWTLPQGGTAKRKLAHVWRMRPWTPTAVSNALCCDQTLFPKHRLVSFPSEIVLRNRNRRFLSCCLRTQSQYEMRLKVLPLQHSTLLTLLCSYTCVPLLSGPSVASMRAVWSGREV